MKSNVLESWGEWMVELAIEIIEDLKDKKFTVWEGFGLTDNALKLPNLIRRAKEFKDLEITDEMQKELSDKFASKFKLDNERAERLVQHSIKSALALTSIVKGYVDILAPKEKEVQVFTYTTPNRGVNIKDL